MCQKVDKSVESVVYYYLFCEKQWVWWGREPKTKEDSTWLRIRRRRKSKSLNWHLQRSLPSYRRWKRQPDVSEGEGKAEEAVNKIRKDSEEIDFSECFDEDDTDAGIEAEDETSIEVDDIAEAADMVAEEAAAEAGEEKEDAAEKEEK